jgi:hypothetical protein
MPEAWIQKKNILRRHVRRLLHYRHPNNFLCQNKMAALPRRRQKRIAPAGCDYYSYLLTGQPEMPHCRALRTSMTSAQH